MKTSTIAAMRDAETRPTRDASSWLALAASPTFALMAWVSMVDAAHSSMCGAAAGLLPIDGMSWMYVLMSLFHASPWLKLALRCPLRSPQPPLQEKGD